MSLLRLLTAGKSLIEFKDAQSAYRLTSQRLLPQFGPARNPFSGKAKSNAEPAEGRSPSGGGEEGPSGERLGSSSSSGKSAAALRSGEPDRKASACAGDRGHSGALRLRAAALLKSWKDRFCVLTGHARGRAAKPAIPRSTRQPVQGELSLDKVKVVRNDLSDVDLEVVPAKRSPTRASAAPASRNEARTGVAESSWGRVAGRIFGAGKA